MTVMKVKGVTTEESNLPTGWRDFSAIKPVFAMPRSSMAGLLITMIACYLPHLSRLPWWMVSYAVICIVWRLLIHVGKAGYPHVLVKFSLAMLGTLQLIREYGTLMSPDGGVAFLLLAYFAKLLEMHYRRDALVVMLLSFFVIPMQFLYDTTLGGAAWVIACELLIVATLVSFHHAIDQAYSRTPLVKSLKLVSLAIPVTVILFLFFPRLPPFWNLPTSNGSQTIGLSDQIDTETLSTLFKSGAVAFRAEFENPNVERKSLYWRGIVLEYFDGSRWLIRENTATKPIQTKAEADALRYKIYLEPSQQRFVFGLANVKSIGPFQVFRSDNGMLTTEKPVVGQTVYSASSDLRTSNIASTSTPIALDINRQLNRQTAPKTQALAKRMFQAADRNPQRMVNEITRWIFTNNFFYTLDPPAMGGDRIDDFLFRTRAGYCSHYASAAAVMLRSVGVPARVIAGYQGGEYQTSGNYWMVHQYDAHAWVEYWDGSQGWVMFDPTAAISPLRIEKGMEEMGNNEGGKFFDSYSVNQWPVLRQIRRSIDYLNYQWIINVVGFQQQEQSRLMSEWFGGKELRHWLPWLIGTVSIVGVLVMAFVHWRDRPAPPHELDRLMLAALAKIRRRFRPRKPAETMSDYCIAYTNTGAVNGPALLQLCGQYHRLRYGELQRTNPPIGTKTERSNSGRLSSSTKAFRKAVQQFK